ncbi:MAG: type II toxin-antitoxin system PemK/MazF family toxin [Patescibacteria group bacterium]
MVKKFIDWIFEKIAIDKNERSVQVNEGEVYWCSLGENIGDEENGKGETLKRPVLIFKKFNKNIFWGIPMSSRLKENKYYVRVKLKNNTRSVMISQLRLLDTKRLDIKIGYISSEDFELVRKSIINLLSKK